MKLIRYILKQPSFSLLSCRFYSTRNIPLESSHERQNTYENSLQTETNKSIYYFEDGLRKVYPFYYSFAVFCKGRWINRNILDVFCDEHILFPREEFIARISKGSIKVNNKLVKTNYVLKNADLISSCIHRHELSVLACPIKILFENENFLVVDKPPSIPVHPCGLYYNNSLLSILSNEYGRNDLYVIYRLDRLTSGVVVFTKSSEKSRELHNEMTMRNVNKLYVCRVEGNFPEGTIVCNKPLKRFVHKIGACLVHPEGKVCITEFKKLSYNGKSSVVLCKPHTGRTHQIRVHLQYLGHPIINDPIYNSFVFGPNKGKNGFIGKTITQFLDDLHTEQSTDWSLDKVRRISEISSDNENYYLKFSIFKEYYHMNEVLPNYKKDCSRFVHDKNCYFCRTPHKNPQQSSLGLFLHAFKYKFLNWEFESDMPFWASEGWDIA